VITADGDITTKGNLVIGTSGKGIDFAATSDAGGMSSELLDDYEEGTWTGVYKDGSGNLATMNGSNTTGTYTKVGRLVTCTGDFKSSSLGSMSGAVILQGLPYTIAANNENYTSVSIGYGNALAIAAGTSVGGNVEANTTEMYLTLWDATGGTTGLDASELSADGRLIMGFSYNT